MLATAPDGAKISYFLHERADQSTAAETILLHHGLRSNHHTWDSWIPLLTKYRTVVIDARGRGESTVPPPGYDWSIEQFSSDALAVMDAVGVDRFHWVATSFGSAIGEYTAATSGARLKSLVLTSPPYRFDHLKHVIDEWIADYERLGGKEYLKIDVRRMFPEDTEPALLDDQAAQMAAIPDYVATDLLSYMSTVNLSKLLPDIKVPTLILGAKQSDRAPSSEAEFMVQQIPDCELVVFDSHHNITMSMPEKCVELVTAFIDNHRDA